MASFPVEIWQKVFSVLDYERDQRSLLRLCRSCKTFNAIGQPMVFRKISGRQSFSPRLGDALHTSNGPALGSMVQEIDMDLTLQLVGLSIGEDWLEEDRQDAHQAMRRNTKVALGALSFCSNVHYLRFKFDHQLLDDFRNEFYSGDFEEPLVPVLADELLSWPYISSLRHLALSCGDNGHFDLSPFGHLIAAAEQLTSIRLGEIDQAALFDPLRERQLSASDGVTRSSIELDCRYEETNNFYVSDLRDLPLLHHLKLAVYDLYGSLTSTRSFNSAILPASSVTSLHLILPDSPPHLLELPLVVKAFPALRYWQLEWTWFVLQSYQQCCGQDEAPKFLHLQTFSGAIHLQKRVQIHPHRHDTVNHLKSLWRLIGSVMPPTLRNFRLSVRSPDWIPDPKLSEYIAALQMSVDEVPDSIEVEIVFEGMSAEKEKVYHKIARERSGF